MSIYSLIKHASSETPDPERALKNFERFMQDAPEVIERHIHHIEKIAKLFSYSQFLSDYILKNPSSLATAFDKLEKSLSREEIIAEALNRFSFSADVSQDKIKSEAMRLLREIKKNYLLIITLKDVSGMSDFHECMSELSLLAETIIELSLMTASSLMRKNFGIVRENNFSLIGMGKLGAGELNYSSDIDIMTIYHSDEGHSTGILNLFGIRCNRISANEYFCRLTEILTSLLHTHTEEGIAYRVDLRLRPNGQKGPISTSLDYCRSYYEAWGKTWERIALIRARPVAGDHLLGKSFIQTVEPFVWKKSIDYNDIGEVRELKKKIDSIYDINDIKRGYGGIREIEFFIQIFQLLYGGEIKDLRKGSLFSACAALEREGLLQEKDVETLTGCYAFLRRLEHILQMKDDLQTHSLPLQADELNVLAKKMHFSDEREFSNALRLKRLKIRDMYNSLLGTSEESASDVILNLKDELPDEAVIDYLSFKGFKDPDNALKNINALSEYISIGKTMNQRTLLRKTIPLFLKDISKSPNKDICLSMLVSFIEKIGIYESYIDLLLQREETRRILIKTFVMSSYLSRLLLSLDNLEGIFEYPDVIRNNKSFKSRLLHVLKYNPHSLNAIREIKALEELKAGFLFLDGFSDVYGFLKSLSSLAEIIIKAAVNHFCRYNNFGVIGLGGFGAKELNIASDLDLIFIGSGKNFDYHEANFHSGEKFAEELIKFLSGYTAKGIAYKVDMRLRPDGSKGILINDIEGYRNYYLKYAKPWEIQMLLRARPIAGSKDILIAFQTLLREIIIKRGYEINGNYIKQMRDRIILEASKESSGYDIKSGPGGIKEIEFLIQFLQLKYARKKPELINYSIITAIKRLSRYAILDKYTGNQLLDAHRFLRTVETLLRLNEKDILKADSELASVISIFLGINPKNAFIEKIENTRRKILDITERFYV